MAALLSKRDRALNPEARVAKLARIAKRAEAKADWLDEILSGSVMDMGLVDVVETAAERDRARDRALEAANELVTVVVENPDAHWTLPQRRAAATWERER